MIMLSRIDRIPECDRRTDRQNCYISIAHQHAEPDAPIKMMMVKETVIVAKWIGSFVNHIQGVLKK